MSRGNRARAELSHRFRLSLRSTSQVLAEISTGFENVNTYLYEQNDLIEFTRQSKTLLTQPGSLAEEVLGSPKILEES